MKKYERKVFLALLLIALQIVGAIPVQAEQVSSRYEIRVGLTSLYSNKETLTIYNNKIGYGYCVDNVYLQEMVLESSSGFTFTPVNGYYVSETVSYASYQAAKKAADNYQRLGVEAYAGSVYQCSWRVYFGSFSKYANGEVKIEELKKATGKDSFEILPGNNYRVEMTGTFGKILLDVEEKNAYPQFRPVTAYEKNVNCIDMGDRVYRGRMEIGRYGKPTLTAVNVVELEE